jgi:hypothetical protein
VRIGLPVLVQRHDRELRGLEVLRRQSCGAQLLEDPVHGLRVLGERCARGIGLDHYARRDHGDVGPGARLARTGHHEAARRLLLSGRRSRRHQGQEDEGAKHYWFQHETVPPIHGVRLKAPLSL